MDSGIAGKVALVSGGSKGMGRAIAEELGRERCRVIVRARRKEEMAAAVAFVARPGPATSRVSSSLSTAGLVRTLW